MWVVADGRARITTMLDQYRQLLRFFASGAVSVGTFEPDSWLGSTTTETKLSATSSTFWRRCLPTLITTSRIRRCGATGIIGVER